ncbi:MAG: site-specific DNA-methyltransferase [Ignavibacteria bacterium]|nr:MAG: site-specific DNA-methyltransferase [Ignavibacteria bacterium]
MDKIRLPRLDKDEELCGLLSKYCRLKKGESWYDENYGHKVGCLDIADSNQVLDFFEGEKATLAIHDPPYNLVAFQERDISSFIEWVKDWVELTNELLTENASLYLWLGADQNDGFSPLPEIMLMMRETPFKARSFITMRNQRGYGTIKNWMAIRQELLYYIKGNPTFNSEEVYTDIPKVVRGYYKEVNGRVTENLERSRSKFIRAGNVWIDIQQVFHLMEENVSGCFAQKPLKAIERIISVSSAKDDLVIDFFAHSGTTLLAAEKLHRKCFTIDIDPIYCEISIRRLENYRKNGKTGWQLSNPFENEVLKDEKIKKHLRKKYKLSFL